MAAGSKQPPKKAAKAAPARRARKTAARPPVPAADPVTQYALDVVAERIVAGRLVRLACERHLRDLEDGAARGLRFDAALATRAIRFIETFCRHSKGKWAGQPVVLSRWQRFIVGALFGWMRRELDEAGHETGGWVRRFRVAYNEIARKNGKSTLAAAIALYLLVADGEPGAEVYCAATKRDQAKIVWEEAKRMVAKSPSLAQRVTTGAANLHVLATSSKLEPLGADADTMDGLNPSAVIIDELHAHKTSAVVDVLNTATGARRQPLQFEITTAGYDRTSICWQHHQYGEQLLEGIVQDDAWFVFIAAPDKDDDWRDPTTWAKANPNLGVSVNLPALEEKCTTALQMPAEQNAFKRLRLNIWTEQADRWLDLAVWDACAGRAFTLADLAGRPCYGGLDLASTQDVTALELVFPPVGATLDEDDDAAYEALLERGIPDAPAEGTAAEGSAEDPYVVLSFFWVPDETVTARAKKGVPYDQWRDAEQLFATEGNVVDYDVIREFLRETAEVVEIREIAYDRWNASQLVTNLTGDGFTCVPIGQGFASMSAPTKELEKLLLSRRIVHGGHPVLRWMASNVAAEQDAAGNIKPSKKRSAEKIDGIVALVMGIARAIAAEDDGTSVYEDRDLLSL